MRNKLETLTIISVVRNNDILDALQAVEYGLSQSLPDNIRLWDNRPINGQNKGYFHSVADNCACCKISEPLIWHHVYTKHAPNKESTSGQTTYKDFNNLLGVIRLCPNCHYYIHQGNNYKG